MALKQKQERCAVRRHPRPPRGFDIHIQPRRMTSSCVHIEGQSGGDKLDLLARTVPDLCRHAAPGHVLTQDNVLIHDHAGWRLHGRLADLPMS